MDYAQLSQILLNIVFSNSAIKTLERFIAQLENPLDDPGSASLTDIEWKRLRWSYWSGAYSSCVAALWDQSQLSDFDLERIVKLLDNELISRIPSDSSIIVVGDYIRDKDTLKWVKRTGIIECSFFRRLETRESTLGQLASTIAPYRLGVLSSVFAFGITAFDRGHGITYPEGIMLEPLFVLSSQMPQRTKAALTGVAIVLAGWVLEQGSCGTDKKSRDVADLVLDRFDETFKECCSAIREATEDAPDHL